MSLGCNVSYKRSIILCRGKGHKEERFGGLIGHYVVLT
jgi:hypothetical protein